MNSEYFLKFNSGKPEINKSRRTFLKYFPRRLSAVYLATNAAITTFSGMTAAFIAGCASIDREMHIQPDYPHPWERDYITKTVSYDKMKTLKKRGSRIKGTYVDWSQILPANDPLVRDELNEIFWYHDFGDERDIVLSLLHHISAKKSSEYIEKIRKRIRSNYYGVCKELSAMLGSVSIASGVNPEKLAFVSGLIYRHDELSAHSWVGYKHTNDKMAADQLGIDFFLNSPGTLYYADTTLKVFKPNKECADYYHYNFQSCFDGSMKEFLWPEKQDIRSLKKKGYNIERADLKTGFNSLKIQ